MRALLCLLSMAMPILAADNIVTGQEAQDGWILLFDGKTTAGWAQEGNAKWKIANGVVSFDGSDSGVMRTRAAFTDFVLKLDYRASADPDASVFLRISADGKPQDSGYELRLGDSDSKWPAGSIAKVFKGDGKLAANQWHTLEAEFNADKISVKIDGRKAGEGSDGKSKAGFISLSGNRGATVDFKNIRLKPTGTRLFNGSDLTGWKSVGETPPPPKSGPLSGIEKMFKGKGKPKEAKWSVMDGAIHGTEGPGQLESQAAYDDFVLQIEVRVNSKNKGHHPKTAVVVRGDAGKLGTGYEVQVENEVTTGAIAGLKLPHLVLGKDNEFFAETIAVRGRHFEIWINGNRVNEYDDTRAEGASTKKEARITGGPIALLAPDNESNLDFRNVKIEALPKALGGHPGAVAAAAPPPPLAVAAPPPSLPPAPAAPGAPTANAPGTPPPPIIFQNPNQAKDDAKQAQVSKLTQQALHTDDPAQQASIYENILTLDPSNLVASQGYRDAEQKIEQNKTQQQKAAEEQAKQSQEAAQKSATFDTSMKSGEAAFLAGDLAGAQSQLAIAQKADPQNPQLQNLQTRVNTAVQARQRITWLEFGGGAVVLLGAVGLLVMSLGKKEPYLEVEDGMDKGKRFGLDQEVTHIGAIPQDGEAKNEIVLRDTDRMISRFHCEIHRQGSKLFLIDVNSANGTFLDRRPIPPEKPVRLKKGSEVVLGGTCTLRVGFEKKKKG
jgi:hypothetical protein